MTLLRPKFQREIAKGGRRILASAMFVDWQVLTAAGKADARRLVSNDFQVVVLDDIPGGPDSVVLQEKYEYAHRYFGPDAIGVMYTPCLHSSEAESIEFWSCYCKRPEIGLLMYAQTKLADFQPSLVYPPGKSIVIGGNTDWMKKVCSLGMTWASCFGEACAKVYRDE